MHQLMKDLLSALDKKTNEVKAGSVSFTFKDKDFRFTDIGLIPIAKRWFFYGLGEGEFNGAREGIIITLPQGYDTTRFLPFTSGAEGANLLPSVEGFTNADTPIGGPGFKGEILNSTFGCDSIRLIKGVIKLI